MAGQKMGTVRRNSFLTGLSDQEEEELGKGAGRESSFERERDKHLKNPNLMKSTNSYKNTQ